MVKHERRSRHDRISKLNTIPERIANYIIFTDTEDTEKNYLNGLKKSLPQNMQRAIKLKVYRSNTAELVQNCKEKADLDPTYSDLWIVFDRDKVVGFDEIIADAQNNNVNVAWSNPCIEIWFGAYFGQMNYCSGSVSCCDNFDTIYQRQMGHHYDKADIDIYRKLYANGNEQDAIMIAKQRHNTHKNATDRTPKDMNPCSTIYELVSNIAKFRK